MMGYLQETGITRAATSLESPPNTGDDTWTPETLEFSPQLTDNSTVWTNLLPRFGSSASPPWSLHFTLLGRNLKNLSRHCSLDTLIFVYFLLSLQVCEPPLPSRNKCWIWWNMPDNATFIHSQITSLLSFFLSSLSLSPLSLILWKWS